MKSISTAIATSSLVLLAACAGEATRNQGPQQPQWKEVTKMENGVFVTYQVPVNQAVPNGVKVRQFDTNAQANSGSIMRTSNSAQQTKTQHSGVWGTPISSSPMPSITPSGTISQDAEVEIGQAEIMVRNLRTRYETALSEFNLARQAAERGDSASVIKFSKTAIALTRDRN